MKAKELEYERSVQLQTIQERIGYTFKNVDLLDTALTHSSFVKGDGRASAHNERLEFLGDAVLELCVSRYLYLRYPQMDEGKMTRARALTVYEQALFTAARQFALGAALRLSRGEEHSGGRDKPSILSDALEAVIGAVYLDGGMEAAEAFVLGFAADFAKQAMESLNTKDYKTQLQEYMQKRHLGGVEYVLITQSGPDHQKVFAMQCRAASGLLGSGTGRSKQEAGQQAAREALKALGQL